MSLAQPVVAAAAGRILRASNLSAPDLLHDRIHDVFVSLWRNNLHSLREFRGENAVSLNAYLRTITTHCVYTWLEKEGRLKTVSHDDHVVIFAPPSPDAALLLAAVERCLKGEKERDRTIFWLKNRHGYTPHQIAALPGIGLQKDGVETVLTRLLKAVAACIKKKNAAPEGLHP